MVSKSLEESMAQGCAGVLPFLFPRIPRPAFNPSYRLSFNRALPVRIHITFRRVIEHSTLHSPSKHTCGPAHREHAKHGEKNKKFVESMLLLYAGTYMCMGRR
jgi:hypothetical protein